MIRAFVGIAFLPVIVLALALAAVQAPALSAQDFGLDPNERMELGEPDASGRRRPVPIEGSEFDVDCDNVIAAVGQAVDRKLVEAEGVETTGWGLAVDSRTLATNLPGVFAGGDAVLGADLAVRAVAAGRIAAVSIGLLVAPTATIQPGRQVEGHETSRSPVYFFKCHR